MNNPSRSNRRIALFPGAFRPPHTAHCSALLDLLARPDVDEAVVIISNRSRQIPGTTKALDAETARRIWAIYLADVANVRIEIAPHAAVDHALGYFKRVRLGDSLLFCIGEADFARGDGRFDEITALAKESGVAATVVAASTSHLQIRATDLRATLARGRAGRDEFVAALPASLTTDQQSQVWRICREGMREIEEISLEKVTSLILQRGLGKSGDLHPVKAGKVDPVFYLHAKDDQRLFVKYAGDTVAGEGLGKTLSRKPRRRLGTELRALRRLTDYPPDGVELPTVILFEKKMRTLVQVEVCPGGHALQDDLAQGFFDSQVAKAVGRFLAHCHTLPQPIAPVWGDAEIDMMHWHRMLMRSTAALQNSWVTAQTKKKLTILMHQSQQASQNHLFHLDFVPKNIRVAPNQSVGDQTIGVIDFELSSSIGDPAYDLGTVLGHYLFWGLRTATASACHKAMMNIVASYRQGSGDSWFGIFGRVAAFTGVTLLSLAGSDPVMHRPASGASKQGELLFTTPLLLTAQALLALGSNHYDADYLLQAAAYGELAAIAKELL